MEEASSNFSGFTSTTCSWVAARMFTTLLLRRSSSSMGAEPYSDPVRSRRSARSAARSARSLRSDRSWRSARGAGASYSS